MKLRRPTAALAAALTLCAVAVGAPTAAASGEHETVTVCFAAAARPHHERTVHVPSRVADRLIETTASYRGPCASYGESAPRGDGWLTAYSQAEHRVPRSVGLVFSASTLQGLPESPPTDGKWCYDKDGDGSVDQMTECSNGYESALRLSKQFRNTVDTPLTYLLVNWNPHGHGPPNVYDLPHFDIHFYLNAESERLKIRPGPCPELVNCEDYELGKKLPAPRYRPADFEDLDALAPAMGNHLIDRTGPEFHGQRFTHTLIYGVWNRDVTFYEPMVTHEWFTGLVDGGRDDACFPIKQPRAWQQSGWYPTKYCLRYRENRDELTTSLEGFVHRTGS